MSSQEELTKGLYVRTTESRKRTLERLAFEQQRTQQDIVNGAIDREAAEHDARKAASEPLAA